MQIHELKTKKRISPKKKVGRGGKRGKTSGKGTKGQKSRAGRRIRPEIKDMIKKMPKLRGHGKNRSRSVNSDKIKYQPVNLITLEENFESGAEISPKTLLMKGLVSRRKGKNPPVKLLGGGEISKKFTVINCVVSESALKAIKGAGGSVSPKA